MIDTCLCINWHFPSVGIIIEVVKKDCSDFYFNLEGQVRGPFDSFFDNGEIIEFHYSGLFFQLFIESKEWYAVAPWVSFLFRFEKAIEVEALINVSEEFFEQTPHC